MTLNQVLRRVRREADVCWPWPGAKRGGRSGLFYGAIREGGRQIGAHRWLYERMVGPVAEGMDLDHLCRNTLCVNPAHLEPVSHAENIHRGKRARGQENGRATLSDHAAAEIRTRASAGERRAALAEEYGVTVQHVGVLVRGYTTRARGVRTAVRA